MVAVTESSFLHLSWCHQQQQLWHIPLYLCSFILKQTTPVLLGMICSPS